MLKELVIATHNQGKVEEFKVLMKDLPIEIKYLADFDKVEEPAETGRTFAANARLKAVYYAKKLGKPCIADDSGLEVQALDGAPGVRSARYAGEEASDEDNNNLLLHNMKFQVKRTCRFRCALCVAQPDGKVLNEVDGVCDGMLLHAPLGNEGSATTRSFGPRNCTRAWARPVCRKKIKSAIVVKLFAGWWLSGAKRNENRHHRRYSRQRAGRSQNIAAHAAGGAVAAYGRPCDGRQYAAKSDGD